MLLAFVIILICMAYLVVVGVLFNLFYNHFRAHSRMTRGEDIFFALCVALIWMLTLPITLGFFLAGKTAKRGTKEERRERRLAAIRKTELNNAMHIAEMTRILGSNNENILGSKVDNPLNIR
jgi:predicted membrane protein